ncbi:phage tail protein [Actinomadura oligospora]|uniref:phage tail protein n=1 Tax=Actinomadura oligospora TaxID=111804 RepID=UPI0004B9B711|nr:hypothetical protein [Actinomadura oligospora]
MSGGAGGHEVERLAVKVVPDTGGFKERLKAFLDEAEAGSKVEVDLELKGEAGAKAELDELARDLKVHIEVALKGAADVKAELRDIARNRTIALQLKLNTGQMRTQLQRVTHNRDLTVNVKLDLGKARAELDLFLRPRRLKVHVDMDRNSFGQLMAGVSQLSSMIRNSSAQMRQMGQVAGSAFQSGTESAMGFSEALGSLGPVIRGIVIAGIVVLVGALIGLVIAAGAVLGALLTLVPVAGALGLALAYLFKSNDKIAKGFRKNLQGVLGTARQVLGVAVRPLAKEISKQLPAVQKWIRLMGGPLRLAFNSVSKYVAPLAKTVTQFGTSVLQGIVRALTNPQMVPAVNGFRTLITDLGTAIGSFFTTLAQGGTDYGKTLTALGSALRTLAPSLAQMLNSFAKVSPQLINEIATALKAIFDTLGNGENLKALADFAQFSFILILATLSTVMANIKFTVDLWHSLYDGAVWVINGIVAAWNACVSFLEGLFNGLGSFMTGTSDTIKGSVVGSFLDMVNRVASAMNSLSDAVSRAWSKITGDTSSGAKSTQTAAVGPFGGMASSISGIMASIVSTVSSAWAQIASIAGRITSLISSVTSKVGSLGNVLGGLHLFAASPSSENGDPGPTPFAARADAPDVSTFGAASIYDSVDQLSRVDTKLRAKYARAFPAHSGESAVKSTAQKIYNITVNAAPNVPTETTLLKHLRFADALYG